MTNIIIEITNWNVLKIEGNKRFNDRKGGWRDVDDEAKSQPS